MPMEVGIHTFLMLATKIVDDGPPSWACARHHERAQAQKSKVRPPGMRPPQKDERTARPPHASLLRLLVTDRPDVISHGGNIRLRQFHPAVGRHRTGVVLRLPHACNNRMLD